MVDFWNNDDGNVGTMIGCLVENGKYRNLLCGSKLLDDILVCKNYFKGVNSDGKKYPKDMHDVNIHMMDKSFRAVEEDISAMRTYALMLFYKQEECRNEWNRQTCFNIGKWF